MKLALKVTPRASRNAIEGMTNGRLTVRVTAPPVDSAANDAVISLVAKALGIARSRITLTHGAASRNKTIEISGVEPAEALSKLRIS